jgi:site-specific DNA recombinase
LSLTKAVLMTLVNRVDIKAEHIEIRIYRQRLHDLLQAPSIASLAPPQPTRSQPDDILRLKVKARLQRVGREMKLVVNNADVERQPIQVCYGSLLGGMTSKSV